jgi:uncharacterized phage-associated protein
MATALQVAEFFLAKNDPSQGDSITPLKLQKLLYYAPGSALATLDRPLFNEIIKAWDLGPVCISIYHRFKIAGNAPIDRTYKNSSEAARALKAAEKPFSREEIHLLELIFACYGSYTAWALSGMSHETTPWIDAFPDRVISRKAMKKYFSDRLKGAKVEILPLTREEADEIAVRLGAGLQ